MNFTRPTTKTQRDEWALLSTEERAAARRLAESIHGQHPEMPATEVWAQALTPEAPEGVDPFVVAVDDDGGEVLSTPEFTGSTFEEAVGAVLAGGNPEAVADALVANTTTGSRAEQKIQRLMGAEAEAAAVKAWREAGEVGDQPPTPNLDALKANATATPTRRPSSKVEAPPVADGFLFVTLRGKVLPGAVRQVIASVDESNRLVFTPAEAQTVVDVLRTLASTSPQHVAWMLDATIARIRQLDPTTTDTNGGTTAKAVDALRACGLKWEATTRGDGSPVFTVEGHDKPISARAALKVAAVKGGEVVAA